MEIAQALASALVPPLCAACGRACRPQAALCTRCGRRLAGAEPLHGGGPPGLDRCWSSASYDGVARDLVAALKFRHLLPVAELMAERIGWLAPAHLLSGTVVPVPPAPPRLRRRGFDPAGELAAALAELLDAELEPCLQRRGDGRQVGRRRAERVGHPPRIQATSAAPRSALLVDDVLTTGATLTACAKALRSVGATRVVAVTFARRL
jgi:predicted amidophosphoribosyltransferase